MTGRTRTPPPLSADSRTQQSIAKQHGDGGGDHHGGGVGDGKGEAGGDPPQRGGLRTPTQPTNGNVKSAAAGTPPTSGISAVAGEGGMGGAQAVDGVGRKAQTRRQYRPRRGSGSPSRRISPGGHLLRNSRPGHIGSRHRAFHSGHWRLGREGAIRGRGMRRQRWTISRRSSMLRGCTRPSTP
jgi:hypothetical protein